MLAHKQLAALVGVAPLNRDSGSRALQTRDLGWTGAGACGPVHEHLVARSAAGTPVLRAFWTRLREQGKPPKVALVACMHKLLTILNAMLKQQTPWQPTVLRA